MVDLSRSDKLWNKSKLWKVQNTIDKHRTHELPKLTVPTLMQTEWWIDRNKKPHRVEEMTLHHVKNLINYLERSSRMIYGQYQKAYLNSIVKVFKTMNEGSGWVDCYTGREVKLAEFWGDERAYEFALAEADAFFGNLQDYLSASEWMADTPMMKALRARLV